MLQFLHLGNGDNNTTSTTVWLGEFNEMIKVKMITSTANVSQGCTMHKALF